MLVNQIEQCWHIIKVGRSGLDCRRGGQIDAVLLTRIGNEGRAYFAAALTSVNRKLE